MALVLRPAGKTTRRPEVLCCAAGGADEDPDPVGGGRGAVPGPRPAPARDAGMPGVTRHWKVSERGPDRVPREGGRRDGVHARVGGGRRPRVQGALGGGGERG